ncbi:MAG TPA: hypothetical protein VN541_03100 [Tepidisphaeraceae bacterium]|nr:hypothetical protein [Tepidisphaeraceae bacterium]
MWIPRSRSEAKDFARFVGRTELILAGILFLIAAAQITWTGCVFLVFHAPGPALGNLWYSIGWGAMLLGEWLYLQGRAKRYLIARHRCARCGYDLTGNTSGVCPECGTPVPRNPRDRA